MECLKLDFKKDILSLVKKELKISGNKLSHTNGKKLLDALPCLQTEYGDFTYIEVEAKGKIVTVVVCICFHGKAEKIIKMPEQIGDGEVIYFLELRQFCKQYHYEIWPFYETLHIKSEASLQLDLPIYLSRRCDPVSLIDSYFAKSYDYYTSLKKYRYYSADVYIPTDTIVTFDKYEIEKINGKGINIFFYDGDRKKDIVEETFQIEYGILKSASLKKDIVVPDEVKEIASDVFNDDIYKTITLNQGLLKLNSYWKRANISKKNPLQVKNMPSTIQYIDESALPIFESPSVWMKNDISDDEIGEAVWGKDLGMNYHPFIVLPYDLKYISPYAFNRSINIHLPVFFTEKDKPYRLYDELEEGFNLLKEGANFKVFTDENSNQFLYSKDGKKLIMFFNPSGNKIYKVNIPESCEIIGEGAFYCCRVKEIVCPKTLKEVHYMAFTYSNLKKITFNQQLPKFIKQDGTEYDNYLSRNRDIGLLDVEIVLNKE